MLLQQNTPMIIRRNEALRTANNIELPAERRLKAEDEALMLTTHIMTRTRRAVDAEVKLIPPSTVDEIVSIGTSMTKRTNSSSHLLESCSLI